MVNNNNTLAIIPLNTEVNKVIFLIFIYFFLMIWRMGFRLDSASLLTYPYSDKESLVCENSLLVKPS